MKSKPYLHRAKYYETDQMAIVHHSNYIRWFEDARIEWMEQAGIPYDAVEKRGIIIPVIGVTAEYRSMTHFREQVAVSARLASPSAMRCEMLRPANCAAPAPPATVSWTGITSPSSCARSPRTTIRSLKGRYGLKMNEYTRIYILCLPNGGCIC